jgi:hypothetical protein
MKVKDSKTCVNPWIGLLVIAGICLVMSIAVFVQFEGENLGKGNKMKGKMPANIGNKGGHFTQVAFSPVNESVEKIVF